MKIGILTDVLNEHSGARASIRLGETLAKISQTEVVFFATDQLLSQETFTRLKKNQRVRIFKKPNFISLELIGILQREGLDLISAHCSLRILISAYLSGLKIIRTDYGSQFPSLNGSYGSWQVGFGHRLILMVGDLYVFIRDYLKFYFCRQNLAISADQAAKIESLYRKKVGYIYLGGDDFDFEKFSRGRVLTEKIRILSVSRFVPYKGFHLLIDAFKSLERNFNNIELVLVGGQADKKYLEFLKKLAGSREDIQFVFDPADEVLGQLFSSSQIYASGTRWEAFGLPFLEASFFGLATLGFSYFGPTTEVINDEATGLIASSPEEFKDKLRRLIVETDFRQKLGRQGQIFAKNFAWTKCASEYLEMFKMNL